MSTSYDFHCLDCNVTAKDACLYGEIGIETLREAWSLRTEIVKIYKSSFWCITTNFNALSHAVVSFLVSHQDHRVCILSEYGDKLPVQTD